MRRAWIAFVFLLGGSVVAAEPLTIEPVAAPVQIDGVINESEWANATKYETWYETWPDYAWRNGFHRVELSPETVAAIDEAWGPARAKGKDDGKGLTDGAKDKGGSSNHNPRGGASRK